jgi:transcriptional regulator GlxA family with amidase domain
MHRKVSFFIFPGFQLLDLAGPLAAFQTAGFVKGTKPYALQVVSRSGGLVESSAGVKVAAIPMRNQPPDTLIVVGGRGAHTLAATGDGLDIIRAIAGRSRRVASVCTGAFILAAAGLLDGRRATTHWSQVANLQRNYPKVRVDGDRIFIKEGSVWTSAGITAGIDLALALIDEDLGADVSRAVAREMVVYHRRSGGQSQFSAMLKLEPDSDRIRRTLSFARDHLSEPLSVERLAEVACMSPRHFGRAFRVETGETPAKAVERLRTEAARVRVEEGREPIEAIAASAGFSDPERMRRAFLRCFGQPPQALRRSARQGDR